MPWINFKICGIQYNFDNLHDGGHRRRGPKEKSSHDKDEDKSEILKRKTWYQETYRVTDCRETCDR